VKIGMVQLFNFPPLLPRVEEESFHSSVLAPSRYGMNAGGALPPSPRCLSRWG